MKVLLMMLFGFWDLLYAAPPNTPLKTIYTWESNGPRYLSGAWVRATLVPPQDSTGVAYNTVSGTVYSRTTPVDSAMSGTDGKLAIRLPLTSDIAPGGSQWQLVCTYRGVERWSAKVTLSDTTTECLIKILGQAASCP